MIYQKTRGKRVRVAVEDSGGALIDLNMVEEPVVHVRTARNETHEIVPEIIDGQAEFRLDTLIDQPGSVKVQLEYSLGEWRGRTSTIEIPIAAFFT